MQVIKSNIQKTILSVSKDIFISNGFQKTSIRDIANQSGVSLGNIYNYFASKDEIFLSVVYPVIIYLYKLLDSHHGKNGLDIISINDKYYFQQVLDEYFTLVSKHKDILRLLLLDSSQSRMANFVNEYIVYSNSVVKDWFINMKTKYPHINIDFSDEFMAFHTFWMFETIKQVIKTETSQKQIIKTLSNFLQFEIQGWKQIIGI